MKYTFISFLALFSFLVFSTTAEGQIFKKLKKKAQDKLENKVEQKVDSEMDKAADRMVDNSWDSVFGQNAESSGDSDQSTPSPFTPSGNITTEDVYNFDVAATMKIQTQNKKGKKDDPMFMDMHFRDNAQYTGTAFRGEGLNKNQNDLFIIYDLENESMVMLMEDKDRKFSYAYGWKQSQALADAGNDSEDVNWDEVDQWKQYKKIGQKTIAGYSCNGYRSENDDQVIEVWVSHEADIGMQNLFMANANAKQLKGKLPNEYPQGMIMAMTSHNLDNGDKTIMEVTDIRKNINVNYVMANYPQLSLGKK